MTLRFRTAPALAGMLAVALCLASPALAQTTTSSAGGNLGTFIQNVINMLNSNVTRGLAILAIMAAGVAWMFGHLDLRRAGTVIIGIVVVFGSATIVDLITGASGS